MRLFQNFKCQAIRFWSTACCNQKEICCHCILFWE